MDLVCFNGEFLPAHKPLFTAANRSFRYGDGLFETMKLYKGKIVLESLHFDRLLLGLKLLQIENPAGSSQLSKLIEDLCQKNNCIHLARVRLAVFRDEENNAGFIIETFPLPDTVNQWNEQGLSIELYPYARKNPDALSNLKTANFLPYVLAELFAKEKGADDAIVLNAFNFICDSSKANVFLINKGQIYTPALHQGCISGTRRRFLLDQLKQAGYRIHQEEISEQQLLEADEVFLTNSVYDMRRVKKFRDKNYSFQNCFSIYHQMIAPLYK